MDWLKGWEVASRPFLCLGANAGLAAGLENTCGQQ